MKKNILLSCFFILILSALTTKTESFKPFEQCIGKLEKTVKSLPEKERRSLIYNALNGKQGSFFTHKVKPFSTIRTTTPPFLFI